jgi:hypothetical protein
MIRYESRVATFAYLQSNPTRTRVACQTACNVLAMMPIPKHIATETVTVDTGKELRVRDMEYLTEVSSSRPSGRNQNSQHYLGSSGYQPMVEVSVGLTLSS